MMGTAADSAGAAGPSEGLVRAGRSSGRTMQEYTAASGRHDHATFGSGPTRQSDDRDSPTRSRTTKSLLAMSDEARAGCDLQFRQRFFLSDNQRVDVSRLEDSNRLLFFLSNGIFSRLYVADLNRNKRDRGFGHIFRSYPHFSVSYTRALQQSRGIREGN